MHVSAALTRKLLAAVIARRVKSVMERVYCLVEQPSQS